LAGGTDFGEGGRRIIQYKARAAGTVDIEFYKRREWDKNDSIGQYKITVTVKA